MNVTANLGREASLRAMWRALYAASCCVETESEVAGVTNVAQWFDYAPYGSVIASTNTGTAAASRQYIGQFTDQSGLSYLNARYYNSGQGHFITQDPTFLALGNPNQLKQLIQQDQGKISTDPQMLNSYSYARGNPITNNDATGLISKGQVELFFKGLEIFSDYQTGQTAWDYSHNSPNEFVQEQINDRNQLYVDTSLFAVGLAVAGTSLPGAALNASGIALSVYDEYCA